MWCCAVQTCRVTAYRQICVQTQDAADLVDNLMIMADLPPATAAISSPTVVPPSTPSSVSVSAPVSASVPTTVTTTTVSEAPNTATASALNPSLLSAAHKWDIVYLFSEPLILLNYTSGISQPLTALDFDTEIKWMTSALRDANRGVNLYTAPATINTLNQVSYAASPWLIAKSV